MIRVENWPAKLDAAIERARDKPFEWGTHDCCMFAADVVLEMTGVDLAAEYRGKYSDASGAARTLKAAHGIEGVAAHAFGEPMQRSMARRGDVVLVETEGRPALAICAGAVAVAPGQDGAVFIPMDQWQWAWRVGT